MSNEAKERIAKAGLDDRIVCKVGALDALPLEASSIDLVAGTGPMLVWGNREKKMREVHRVLRPGAWFVGSDSVSSRLFEWVHLFDTLVPVDPSTIAERLEAAGFAEVEVGRSRRHFRFRARKPAGARRRERDPQSTGTGNTPT